jgi:hypothetical protein
VNYTPMAQQSFTCQEYEFKKNNIRDTHHDYKVDIEIEGYNEYVTMLNSSSDGKPWYANSTIYWVLSVLMLGWFYRILFVLGSHRCTYDFTKFVTK